MFSKVFWIDAVERAIRTFAQAVLAVQSVDATSTTIQADWQGILTSAAVAAGFSLLFSIIASGTGDKTSAAIINTEGVK